MRVDPERGDGPVWKTPVPGGTPFPLRRNSDPRVASFLPVDSSFRGTGRALCRNEIFSGRADRKTKGSARQEPDSAPCGEWSSGLYPAPRVDYVVGRLHYRSRPAPLLRSPNRRHGGVTLIFAKDFNDKNKRLMMAIDLYRENRQVGWRDSLKGEIKTGKDLMDNKNVKRNRKMRA